MENKKENIEVLLIDDDEDEYVIARDLFAEIGNNYNIHWSDNFSAGLEEISKGEYDICICDYHLGANNGVDFIKQAVSRNSDIPIILLTGQGAQEIDIEAMKAGATDYLEKNNLDSNSLERSIRYALERKKSEDKIRFLAYYDQLTHLPNRTLFMDRVNTTFAAAKRHSRKFAIMFIDIDNFKRINDTLGHNIGDMLIKEVAQRLLRCIRKEDLIVRDRFISMLDTVARLGGDEFTILLSEINVPENASKVAERIRTELLPPVTIEENMISVTVSMGIAIYPEDGENIDTLIKNADVAMYNAKSTGKNSFQYYNSSMNTTASQKLSLESELNKAIENNQFTLYYQPIIELKSRKIYGVEALIRWLHPSKGIILPMTFIPIAEEVGLINKLGNLVLNKAAADYEKWKKSGLNDISIAINISPKQLNQNNFSENLKQIISTHNMPPENLILEITENTIIHNMEEANKKINSLRDSSIRISLDDFGTGYSSFMTLRNAHFDILKIDRSFIKNVPENKEDSVILNSMITIGHSMKLKVIAEGVEEKIQLEFLEKIDCDLAQGYHFKIPVPGEEIIETLNNLKSLL